MKTNVLWEKQITKWYMQFDTIYGHFKERQFENNIMFMDNKWYKSRLSRMMPNTWERLVLRKEWRWWRGEMEKQVINSACTLKISLSFFHLASYLASIYQLYIYIFLQKDILSKYRCLSSGRYNTIPLTSWYTHIRNWFLTVLEAGVWDQGVRMVVSVEKTLSSCRLPNICCILKWKEEGKRAFWSPLV